MRRANVKDAGVKVEKTVGHLDWRSQGEQVIYDPFAMLSSQIVDDKDIWDYHPAHIEEFVLGRDYLGYNPKLEPTNPDYIKPCIVDDLLTIWGDNPIRPRYKEAVFSEGIGTGKSFRLSILGAYAAHVLLCLKRPGMVLGIGDESKIGIVNVSINEENARKVIFTEIRQKITRCMWFERTYQPDSRVTSMLVFDFPPKNTARRENRIYKCIAIMPGHSRETGVVGFSIWLALMDEASLYKRTVNADYAEVLAGQLRMRVTSRFKDSGLLVIAGSPRYSDDYLARTVRDAKRGTGIIVSDDGKLDRYDRPVYYCERSHWDAHYPHYSGRYFYVNLENYRVTREENHDNERAWIAVPLDTPTAYYDTFVRSPIAALRDFGGKTVDAIRPFFEDQDSIDACIDFSRDSAFNDETGSYIDGFGPIDKEAQHVVHIDMSAMKGLDACGIVMCHICGRTVDDEPIVYVDCIRRIIGDNNAPVPIETIPEIIDRWRVEYGFPISLVTLDGWQGVATIQSFQRKGFNVAYKSVDKTLDAYNTLKVLFRTKRIRLYNHHKLREELRHVELINGNKVDHPVNRTKDVADALAGAVHGLLQDVVQSAEAEVAWL